MPALPNRFRVSLIVALILVGLLLSMYWAGRLAEQRAGRARPRNRRGSWNCMPGRSIPVSSASAQCRRCWRWTATSSAARRPGQSPVAQAAQPAHGTAESCRRLFGALPAGPQRRDHRRQQLARLEQLRWQQLCLSPLLPRCRGQWQRALLRAVGVTTGIPATSSQFGEERRRRAARRAGGQTRTGGHAARLGRPAGHSVDRRLAGHRHPHQPPGLALSLPEPAERRGAQPAGGCAPLCRADPATLAEQPGAATRRRQRATPGGRPGWPPRVPLAASGIAREDWTLHLLHDPQSVSASVRSYPPGCGRRVDDHWRSCCSTAQRRKTHRVELRSRSELERGTGSHPRAALRTSWCMPRAWPRWGRCPQRWPTRSTSR